MIAIAAADQAGLDAVAAGTCVTSGARRRWPTRPTPSWCSTRSSPSCLEPHLAYSSERGPRSSIARSCFRSRRTATGASDIDLEFEKDFGHYRFHPRCRWVAERLWTEGSVELERLARHRRRHTFVRDGAACPRSGGRHAPSVRAAAPRTTAWRRAMDRGPGHRRRHGRRARRSPCSVWAPARKFWPNAVPSAPPGSFSPPGHLLVGLPPLINVA